MYLWQEELWQEECSSEEVLYLAFTAVIIGVLNTPQGGAGMYDGVVFLAYCQS